MPITLTLVFCSISTGFLSMYNNLAVIYFQIICTNGQTSPQVLREVTSVRYRWRMRQTPMSSTVTSVSMLFVG